MAALTSTSRTAGRVTLLLLTVLAVLGMHAGPVRADVGHHAMSVSADGRPDAHAQRQAHMTSDASPACPQTPRPGELHVSHCVAVPPSATVLATPTADGVLTSAPARPAPTVPAASRPERDPPPRTLDPVTNGLLRS